MNDHHHNQNKDFCYYHPKQFLVGVCPCCLTEKLLIVEQTRRNHHHHRNQVGDHQTGHSRKPSIVGLPKIFPFGSLFNRLELRHHHRRGHHHHHGTYYDCDEDFGCSDSLSTSTSLEDSFISIKFEDNGVALWDKAGMSKKASQEQASNPATNHKGLHKQGSWKSCSSRSVVEHSRTPRGSLRWRKRIGHFLQLVRWKRPTSPSGGGTHVDGLGGAVKGRNKGWMRSLTRRRACKE